jgi:uncharacterized protein YfaS (alpha-2-macroglobulin family)
MKHFKSFSFVLLTIIVLSCSLGKDVTIRNFTPIGEVDMFTTFTIEFNENIAPDDKLDEWTDEQFMEFDPPITGKYKWVSGNTLLFSPDFKLKPEQQYSAKPTAAVLFGKNLSLDYSSYSFNTPDFDVKSVEFFWTHIPNEHFKTSVQLNIEFNYQVSPTSLKEYLVIKRDDENISDYSILTQNDASIIAVNLGEIQQTEKEQKFSITVKSGFKSIYGKTPLADDRTFDYDLPPITQLAITGVSAGYDGSKAWIEVGTTQKADEKKISKYVSTNPKKDLDFFVSENQFRIEADFENNSSVELIIKKGMPGLYGGELQYEFIQNVVFTDLDPSISFSDKNGKYLMLGGKQNIELKSVNVDKIEIEVEQVFRNNLLHFLNSHSYYYDYDFNDRWGRNYYVSNYGKPLYTEKLNLAKRKNWLEKSVINLDKALGQRFQGIYVVTARDAGDSWVSDAKMIAMSDIGIITKHGTNDMMVFLNSISSAEPLDKVKVSVISTNNQTLMTGKSDFQGIVRFENIKDSLQGFTPRLIIAEKDGDFNYIDFKEAEVETSRFDVGGLYEYSPDYNVFIYSERNLYRPGETMNLSAILRNDMIETVKDIPVIVKIIAPTGKVFEEYKKELNSQGSFELAVNIPDYAQTGEYVAEVYSGAKKIIGAYRFSVEEFVPDKIRVMLSKDKEDHFPGDAAKIKIDAEYLFGSKAANLKYEVDMHLRHVAYRSKSFKDFDFTSSSEEDTEIENVQKDGFLDENGHAEFDFDIPDDIKSKGIVKGYAFVSVFDLTGRTVNRHESFNVYPKKYFIGIKSTDYYYGTNENIKFLAIAVNENDKPIKNFKSSVELIRYEWQTVLKKDNYDNYYYASERKEIPVWKKDYTINGSPKDISFKVSQSGKYELRISKAGEKSYQQKQFYVYGWGSSTASTFEVDKEGRVEIVFDKESYEPGDEAKILFTCPFSGKMLVTFERGGIYKYQYVDVKDRSAEIKVMVDENFMPNAYVTATLFKPHNLKKDSPFLVGHGFSSMKVERKSNKLPVKIVAPTKVKPRTQQSITIETSAEKDIFVTLAAVDEGILQIKGYETPDPYSYMYAKRPLKVNSYDLYELLLPEIVSSRSSFGGDDKLSQQLRKRTNPIKTKRFKLLSYWSGIVKTNSSGKATVKLDIPQFNGDVRLMAVAYEGKRFGSAEEHIKVADDLILQPEIPRFLASNDKLNMNVAAINTTNKSGKATIKIRVEGPIEIVGSKSKSITIPANNTENTSFEIKAKNDIGSAKIIIESEGLAKVVEEIDIAVRPSSPLVTESGSGTVRSGKEVSFNMAKGFMKGTESKTLTVSSFPAIKYGDQFKYLVGYPHGCLEQTVSKLFPQLYFEKLAKLIAPEYFKTTNPVYFVKEGIRKIESMHRYDGSFSYWQGGDYSNLWSTVYAAHFLVEAKKAGYEVSEDKLSYTLSYIATKAREKPTYDYVVWSENSKKVIKMASKEAIYALYVLALADRGDISTLNYYKARPHLTSSDSKYLLAGSYALMGKWAAYHDALPKEFEPEKPFRMSGGNFDSEIRANAIKLNVLLEVDKNNKQIPVIIRYLSQRLKQAYSTQERAFAFLALGKAASQKADSKLKVDIYSGNKKIGTYKGDGISFTDKELKSEKITLKPSGSGEAYYFWNTEGIKTSQPVREEDANMKVRRQYFDYRTKREITGSVEQGKLIVCKISITGYDMSAENIAITDMVPAGLEIENPRLNTSTELSWKSSNPFKPDHVDIRDDRLVMVGELQAKKTLEYYYMLRAVSSGEFTLSPIGAEAMYDPDFHSYHGAGRFVVEK